MNGKRTRQYVGIICALLAYYLIHEGAHLVSALCMGSFKSINLMALGVQIDIFRDQMTDTQLGWFCLVGPLATFVAGIVLIGLTSKICSMQSKMAKAICYYATIAILILDPAYIGFLYRFVGGGDMNGIRLLIPETAASILFLIILAVNLILFFRLVLPQYKRSFQTEE